MKEDEDEYVYWDGNYGQFMCEVCHTHSDDAHELVLEYELDKVLPISIYCTDGGTSIPGGISQADLDYVKKSLGVTSDT